MRRNFIALVTKKGEKELYGKTENEILEIAGGRRLVKELSSSRFTQRPSRMCAPGRVFSGDIQT